MPFDQIPEKYDLVNHKPDRLRYLADLIEDRVPENKLYQGSYHCGSTHCAYGWAETFSAFQALEIPSSSSLFKVKSAFFGFLNENPENKKRHFSYCFGISLRSKDEVIRRLRTAADACEGDVA